MDNGGSDVTLAIVVLTLAVLFLFFRLLALEQKVKK